MAADALAVLDAEGIAAAHVVGHSMGGSIATALAIAAPSRVRSLALLCTFRRGRDATALTPAVLWFGLRTRIGTRAMRRNAFLALVMPRDWLRAVDRAALAREVAGIFGRDLADEPGMTMPQLRALARCDAGDRLAALAAIPTIVVSGADDRIACPASGRALAAAIPGARHVEMPNAGHALTIQRADEINALLRDHFEGTETVIDRIPEEPHATQNGR
jgi:pimeloyl-ACP methyl ester carboxylesterase